MYKSYMVEEIREEKAKIRKSKRKARASFVGQARAEADEIMYNRFIADKFIEKYDSFFVYNSVNSEADTKRIMSAILAAGKELYLPRIVGKEMEAVLYSGNFVKSPFGIEEPTGEAYRGDIDVAVVPGFAFDSHGYRVGYGGGYYDRFLSGRKIFKIGYFYNFQMVRTAPYEEHDVPVDFILTDKYNRFAVGAPQTKTDLRKMTWEQRQADNEKILAAIENMTEYYDTHRDNEGTNEETENETEDN